MDNMNKQNGIFFENKEEEESGNQFKYSQPYYGHQRKNYRGYQSGNQNEMYMNSMRYSNERGNENQPQNRVIHSVNRINPNFIPNSENLITPGNVLPNQNYSQSEFPQYPPYGQTITGNESTNPPPPTYHSSSGKEKSNDEKEESKRNKFSILGLLKIINSNQKDKENSNHQKLALGFDLTTLGLNLNSQDYLHTTFSAPYVDNPLHCVKPNFELPSCYRNFPFTHKRIYKKIQLETLFYIFYSMPNDTNQLRAAKELGNRGWSYHKHMKVWLKCVKVLEKRPNYVKGNYVYFDIRTWEKLPKKNFVFQKSDKYKLSIKVEKKNQKNIRE